MWSRAVSGGMTMIDKLLVKYGVAAKDYTDPHYAASETYMTNDNKLPPTPLTFPENPFSGDVILAKNILDLGCGVGRNAPWIMENTQAHYYGIDPNTSMTQYFWNFVDRKYASRITIANDFDEVPLYVTFDIVVCTFVFQHIGFRPPANYMNVSDITNAVRRFTTKDTIWIMYEHDWEEKWIERWQEECNITFHVYKRDFEFPGLAERGNHHLMVWRG